MAVLCSLRHILKRLRPEKIRDPYSAVTIGRNELKPALAFLTQISRHIWPVTSLKIRMKSTLAAIEIPQADGFKLYTENTSLLISSDESEAFLNPVQEFNRDLSVACIRVWSEEMNIAKEARWRKAQEKKAKHVPVSNQKGSNIDMYYFSSSKTLKDNRIAEKSSLAGKDIEMEIVDNIALLSDTVSSKITEVNIFHQITSDLFVSCIIV